MNSNYYYSNILVSGKNKAFLEILQRLADESKKQIYVLSSPLVDGKYKYDDDSLMIVLSSKHQIAFVTTRAMSDDFEDIVNKSTDCYYLIEKLPFHMLILKGNKKLKKKSKRKKGRNYS